MAHFHGAIAGVHLHGNGESQGATSDAAVTLPGVAAAPGVGAITATGGASVTLPGVAAAAAVGAVSVSTGDPASVTLPGVAAGPGVGAITATGGAAVALVGVSATPGVGVVTVGGAVPATTNPTGYYRRNARDILSGRRRADGAEVMLAIGARRRRY